MSAENIDDRFPKSSFFSGLDVVESVFTSDNFMVTGATVVGPVDCVVVLMLLLIVFVCVFEVVMFGDRLPFANNGSELCDIHDVCVLFAVPYEHNIRPRSLLYVASV